MKSMDSCVEIPNIIRAERHCFRDLTFSALIQRIWKNLELLSAFSELNRSNFPGTVLERISSESVLLSADLLSLTIWNFSVDFF